MSFYTYHSNHLDLLQTISAHIIQNDPLASPFEKEYFLVQNFGMAKWMQVGLAEHLGILTQAEFLLPAKMLNNLFDRIFQGEHALTITRLNQDQLFWPLFILLGDLPAESIYEPLHRYMAATDDQQALRRRLMLAREIATLFDQYIVHRPDWIETWDRHELVADLPDHQLWQRSLWQILRQRYQNPIHFGNIAPYLDRALSDPDVQRRLPKRIFIMGLTSLPPLFLDLLIRFSPHLDIHLFFNNPSQYYWGDVTKFSALEDLTRRHFFNAEENHDIFSPHMPPSPSEDWQDYTGHPLLASFGKVGRDHQRLLAQYEPQEVEAFSEPKPTSLLKHLHYTLFHLMPPAETSPYCIDDQDHSIVIHRVYSRMREIEVLYDQLLHHFNADPTLKPRDIVIMTPNIEEYAPIIEAIFGNADPDRYIPYSISDVSLTTEAPMLTLFMELLTLPESHFRASQIMEMLQVPALYQHFEIEADQLPLIQYWIQDVGIHFGIDDQHLKELAIESDGKNHWLWGLKRLILGYLTGSTDQLFDQHLPYPHVEGLNALLLGKLIHFIDRLIHWRNLLKSPRTLDEWRRLITPLWNDFFQPSDESQQQLSYLLKEWNQLIDGGIEAGFAEIIPISELHLLLKERIENERPEQKFIEGKVTFCSFIPMRAIPFKLVAMIGLTQKAFPTSAQFADFNLMQYRPYPGDRTRHHDDRYLFLEAILSAQSTLYLSYIGRSIQDNSEQFPSLLIDELVDYLCEVTDPSQLNSQDLRTHLLIDHPMAPYNPQLFQENSPIQSFQAEWLPSPTPTIAERPTYPPIEVTHLSPTELINFYRDPIRIFCQKQLDIRQIRQLDHTPNDDEPFIIQGGLTQYQIRDYALTAILKSGFEAERVEEFVANDLLSLMDHQGILPKYHYRDLNWEYLTAPLIPLVATIHQYGYRTRTTQWQTITLDGWEIEGEMPQIINDHQLFWSVGKKQIKRQLEGYLHHLFANHHSPTPITTCYLTLDKEKVEVTQWAPLDEAENRQQLRHYLSHYELGLTTPMISTDLTLTRAEQTILNDWIPIEPDLTFKALYQMDEAVAEEWINHQEREIQQLVTRFYHALPDHALSRRLFPNPGYREAVMAALFHFHFLQNI